MSATDVLVLAFCLLLGVAVGAIAHALFRPASRGPEVRLTITRDALPPPAPPDRYAEELSTAPAGGNPAAWMPETPRARLPAAIPVANGDDPMLARLLRSPAHSGADIAGGSGAAYPAGVAGPAREAALSMRRSGAGTAGAAVAAVGGGHGSAPASAAVARPAAVAVPAVVATSPAALAVPAAVARPAALATPRAGAESPAAVAVPATVATPADRPEPAPGARGEPGGAAEGERPDGGGARMAGGLEDTDSRNDGAATGSADSDPGKSGADRGSGDSVLRDGGADRAPELDATPTPTAGTAGLSDPAEPCAPERRLVEERCALAVRLHEAHRALTVEQREVKRAYDESVAAADDAARAIDGRAVLEAKTGAQRRFRESRLAATTAAELESAARIWLEAIDRLNRAVRLGQTTLTAERERAAKLVVTMDEISVRVDAARIAAESADERCRQAREALAGCEEARVGGFPARERAPRPPAPPFISSAPPSTPVAPSPWSASGDVSAPGGAAPGGAAPGGIAPSGGVTGAPSGPLRNEDVGAEPVVLRIVRGDSAALAHVAELLAAGSGGQMQRWQASLAGLVAALRAAAIDAGALEFPPGHPFWGTFSDTQCREIAVALASLGYRYDGEAGFADERLPSQRDLSLAVGYAGLDPLRIRRWPGEAGTRELFAGVSVAVDEFLATAAPDLTMSELVAALGRRAETLTDLWNAWGRVRPLLLAPA